MYKRLVTVLWCISLFIGVSASAAMAQDNGWPRTLPLQGGTVTIYPLQVDDLNGDRLRFRAALAYRPTGVSEPVFGAGWFESRVEIDNKNGVVRPFDLKVSETRFPAGTDDVQAELAAVFAQQSPGWSLDFPLDELQTALETQEQEERTVQNINTAPPTIIYRDHPALLVNIDGAPVFRTIEKSTYQAVINTPYPLIFDGKTYYLSAAKGAWYRADSATGPYRFDANPPADIVEMVEAAAKAEEPEEPEAPAEKITAANAPEIVVATTPSELIVTEGPAEFVPLVDDLLVLDNSADDVFMHISTQQYYVVLAGRWYHAPSMNGPWTYRPANALPVAFTRIPGNSDQADSRVYVAGTEEAKEAVLDAQIPVTAAVARGPVDMDVSYDGEPSFEPVQGTDLEYADNTSSTVIQSDRQYFLVEDGVWYVSTSPNGPWEVSDYRPEEVAAIAPESPVYNVKYVYVYDSTPEYVYVGYTPGYLGSYVYHDTIVYGTGWYYRPWISPHYYYPRYSTWGFNVGYNPWYGWSFGLSWGWGPFYAGFYSGGYWHHDHYWNHGGYGYWGPRGYWPRWGHHDRYGYGGRGHGDGGYGRGGYGRDYDGRGDYGRGGRGGGGYGRGDYAYDSYGRGANGGSDFARDGGGRGGEGRGGYGGGNRGRDGRGGDDSSRGGSGRGDYARLTDLYRDRAQRATVTDPADPGRGSRDAGRQLSREAESLAGRQAGREGDPLRSVQGGREGNPNREVPGKREAGQAGVSRTGAVTTSDLRAKVANRDALRGRMIADNNREGRRVAQAPIERSEAPGRTATQQRTAKQPSASRERVASDSQRRPVTARNPQGSPASGNTRSAQDSNTRATEKWASRGVPQPGVPRQNGTQQRALPQQAAPQRATQQQRGMSQQAAPQRAMQQRGVSQQAATPQRAMQQRGVSPQPPSPRALQQQRGAPRMEAPKSVMQQQRGAPRPEAPQRAMQQRGVPQQAAAPQRAMQQQRSAPRQEAPQRAMQQQQRSAPDSSNRHASAPSGDSGRQRGNGGHGGRMGGNPSRGGDRGNSGRH